MTLAALVAMTNARGLFLVGGADVPEAVWDTDTGRVARCIEQYATQPNATCRDTKTCTEKWNTCTVYNETNSTYEWVYREEIVCNLSDDECIRTTGCSGDEGLYHTVTSCRKCRMDIDICILDILNITQNEVSTCMGDPDKCSKDNKSLFKTVGEMQEMLTNPEETRRECDKRICPTSAPPRFHMIPVTVSSV